MSTVTNVFESVNSWPEGLLRFSLHVAVWAFARMTSEDNTAVGSDNGGKNGGDYFCYSDNINAADPATLELLVGYDEFHQVSAGGRFSEEDRQLQEGVVSEETDKDTQNSLYFWQGRWSLSG